MENSAIEKQKARPLRLLGGMFVRPRSTFEAIHETGRRSWWLPALLAALMVVLPIVVGAPLRAQQQREAVAAVQEQFGEDVSPEQREQMEQAVRVATSPLLITVFPSVAALVGLAVGWLVWAGTLYLTGMAIGSHASFGALFRTVVWAWIPYAVRGLLQSLYILVSGRLISNPGLSGLVYDAQSVREALAAPPTPGQMVAAAFLGRVDLFLFWNLALLVVGTAVVTRLSTRKAMALVLGIWLLLTGISLLPTLISSLFMRGTGIFGG
ncbi:MAG: Yip1 family protein [Anaerolineae bacterium]|nr:Yip1 family protein [Anaerolineae bacterium]